jgi:hypothetical protein
LLGWAGVLAGLAAFAGLLSIFDRRRRVHAAHAGEAAPEVDLAHEWEAVMRRATRELARGPQVEALHADATTTIESAEHAYNRLVVDCARHCQLPTAPTFEPVQALEPAPKPEAPAAPAAEPVEQEPLAA